VVCKNAELLLFHVAFGFKSLECHIEHSLPFNNIMGAVALKGIVYPKMKILLFTHPHVVPNLFDSVFLLSTKQDIKCLIVFCSHNGSQ